MLIIYLLHICLEQNRDIRSAMHHLAQLCFVEVQTYSHYAVFFWLRLRFVFACNRLDRSWWCCESHIVWTLPLSPVQPICCDEKNRSRNQKKIAQCERALREPKLGFNAGCRISVIQSQLHKRKRTVQCYGRENKTKDRSTMRMWLKLDGI